MLSSNDLKLLSFIIIVCELLLIFGFDIKCDFVIKDYSYYSYLFLYTCILLPNILEIKTLLEIYYNKN